MSKTRRDVCLLEKISIKICIIIYVRGINLSNPFYFLGYIFLIGFFSATDPFTGFVCVF